MEQLSRAASWFSTSRDEEEDARASRRRSKRHSKRRSAQYVPGIKVTLDRAEDLNSADSNGFSDPYVVLRIGKLSKYKSSVVKKTLNPTWLEEFFMACPEHTALPLQIEVRDKDTLGSDFLGEATLDISMLSMGDDPESFTVQLEDDGQPAGVLYLHIARDEEKLGSVRNKNKVKKWAVPTGDRKVVVELIQAREILAGDSNGYSDGYCVLRLNKVKHKSHVVKRSLNPKWRERFEFPLKPDDDSTLKVSLFDYDYMSRNDPLGEFEVDLDDLQPKIVNDRWFAVRHKGAPAGHVHMLITVIDLDSLVLTREQRNEMVGSVRVHCVQARNLRAADMNGKSDPYVEISLGNARLRTPVINRELNPVWDTVLELPAKDIFSCLDITVWDEDRGSKPDHLGSLQIPLLDIHNGQTQWYALKSPDLLRKGQGEIQLAMKLVYKVPHAYMGLIKRKDVDYMEKKPPFSVRRLRNAINRLNASGLIVLDNMLVLNQVLHWELGPGPSIAGVLVWIIVCLFFRPFMIPATLAAAIVVQRFVNYQGDDVVVDERGLVVTRFDGRGFATSEHTDHLIIGNFDELEVDESLDDEMLLDDDGDEDDDEDQISGSAPKSHANKKKAKRAPRKGLMDQIRMLRSIGQEVQSYLEFGASMSERFRNLLNWSVPLATGLVVVALLLTSIITFILPWNILLMLYGLFKFAKNAYLKYLRPRSKFHQPIIEGIELLKRIPSDIEKVKRQRIVTEDMTVKPSMRLFSPFLRR